MKARQSLASIGSISIVFLLFQQLDDEALLPNRVCDGAGGDVPGSAMPLKRMEQHHRIGYADMGHHPRRA
ncbi:MAG: hypothetical protein V8S24_16605 [Gordonibacter pamelaeae]